jgi:hypothetical protein
MSHAITLSALTLLFASGASAQSGGGLSDTAFVLARAGVIPENIVYDAPRDRFLGGDLERDGMIELRRDGSIRPFAEAAGIDGRVLGLKMDPERKLLWGVAFTRLPAAGDSTQAPARSILFALELPGGRLVQRVPSPEDGASHLFNDLVIGGMERCTSPTARLGRYGRWRRRRPGPGSCTAVCPSGSRTPMASPFCRTNADFSSLTGRGCSPSIFRRCG